MKQTENFQPIKLIDIELTQPLPTIMATDAQTTTRYQAVIVLVRLFDYPIARIHIDLEKPELSCDQIAQAIWNQCQTQINDKLVSGNLPPVSNLPLEGLIFEQQPSFIKERNAFLARAPFATVIVCTRDRPEKIAQLLPCLRTLSYPNFEILVVDNAPSTSATEDLVSHLYELALQVHYIREVRPGLSWARNQGLKHAKGEIVAYIDDDELPDRHWLTELAMGFEASTNVACVTGFILPAEIETKSQDWFEQFGGFSKGRTFNRLIFNNSTHRIQNPMFPAPPMGAGGNMAFKADIIRTVGGFDTVLGAGTKTCGAEETAMFYDLITKGYTLVMTPAAFVRHYHYRTYEALKKQLYGYGIGITAFYMRCILKNPLNLINFFRILPRGLYRILSPTSERSTTMRDFPSELNAAQRRGMLYGFIAYFQGLRQQRARVREFGSQD